MRTAARVALILMLLLRPVIAQSDINGVWLAHGFGKGPWTLALTAHSSTISGRVSSCTSLPVEISETRIVGNTITFKCQSPDGDRTISFSAAIDGDVMTVRWTKQVRPGGRPTPDPSDLDPGDPNARDMFGAATPREFVAHRLKGGGSEVAAAFNFPDKGLKVEGTLFVPSSVSKLKAVIVLLNSGFSWGGMGGNYYRDAELRKLATTLECGLLLPRITNIIEADNPPPVIDFLRNAEVGGADAVLQLLDRLGQESRHPEAANMPLMLWGHSRSGHFASRFAALHPQRTIGIVAYHTGAAGMTGHDWDVLRYIPTLMLMAKTDVENQARRLDSPLPSAETLWRMGRSAGAPWTFVVEPYAVHQDPNDLKIANALVLPWITAVIRQRISGTEDGLRPVAGAGAWFGNLRTFEIGPVSTFDAGILEGSWLPDEQSARGWQQVVRATK